MPVTKRFGTAKYDDIVSKEFDVKRWRDLVMRSVFHREVKEVVGAGWLWAKRSLLSLVLLQSLVVTSKSAEVIQQITGPGLVLIEAENFHDNIPQGGHEWRLATSPAGFSGSGFVEATPDSGANIESGYDTGSPRLDFKVSFLKTGTHYVWLRYLKTGGEDDSCHVGIDGKKGTDAENMSATGSNNTWNWTNERRGNLGRAKLEITSAGVKTINMWMREDGFRLDKIILTTDESFEPTDETSEERLRDDILHGKVEPNEPEPNAPEPEEPEPNEPEPSEVRPAARPFLAQSLKRVAYDIGLQVYSFRYEEPGFMEEEGVFYGVRVGYTSRDWVPDSPEESPSGGGLMFRAEGRAAFGKVDYDGALGDGTPLTINNIDDFALEGRLLLGADWLGEISTPILSTLYAGIGYRYLNDDPSSHPAGYERESNYLYLPLGYQFEADLEAGWSWGARLEYDLFLWGKQRSHLSDVDPRLPDVDNEQDSGFGYRGSLRLQRDYSNGIFIIEPFFRIWDIDDSETNSFGIEPANKTTEVGISVIWMY